MLDRGLWQARVRRTWQPAFARGVSRDITKRKLAEEELRESEAFSHGSRRRGDDLDVRSGQALQLFQ